MRTRIKEEIERQIFINLKSDEEYLNCTELETLNELYKTFDQSNFKNIWIPDLLPAVTIVCATAFMITISLLFLL